MVSLVVGANGFLGRHIIGELINNGEKAVAVCHRDSSHIPKNLPVVPFDRLTSVRKPVKAVYFAAGNYEQSYAEMYESQVVFLNKVSVTFPDSVLVYTSSVAVYGEYRGVVNETSAFSNPEPYGMAKLAGEFVASHHPNARIVRLAALYGVGVNPDLFIAAIIRDALKKKLITLEEGGTRIRNFIHVKDAAGLMVKAASYSKPGVFLGTGAKSYTLKEIADMVARLVCGTRIAVRGKNKSLPYTIDNRITRKLLGWQENYPLEKGLEEMIAFS